MTAPDSQLLYFMSTCRLVTILDELKDWGVICKLQKLERGFFFCSAGIGEKGEEKWAEDTYYTIINSCIIA